MPGVRGAEGWRVERQSGVPHEGWRVVQEGEERVARRVYRRLAEDLRVGGLRLVDAEGAVRERASAGRRHR